MILYVGYCVCMNHYMLWFLLTRIIRISHQKGVCQRAQTVSEQHVYCALESEMKEQGHTPQRMSQCQ